MSEAIETGVPPGPPESASLQPLVKEVARQEIMSRYLRVASRRKSDGSLVTDADLAAQDAMRRHLSALWPEIPLLGEEMTHGTQQRIFSEGLYWCLDPLDGTTNFSNGIPFFGLSLALVREGRVTLGVVYDPVREECFRADRGGGAWLNDRPLRLSGAPLALAECVALVDLKRLSPSLVRRLAGGPPYRSQRSLGAVTLEWCWMAAGRCQLYLHGAQKPWDYAAGHLIFQEAGGVGCLFEALGRECNAPASRLGPQAAIGAPSRGLLRQWQEWLGAEEAD
ncbi:MAG: hypothetical protein B0D96_01290 [Candidatus Sedimenticola endophacoides]|uniref:Inositol monophosphatase n=1 Tax=Candidatus Sedimenticola endophacoides TaxID=2548426 RepID=A0A6N4DPI8_9GAMM|nr:MAG: hypothetical protein B0D94_04575 [Candidatus Sedimenticola endophacoides]OQX37769.1 MAG: hypothetical protein B0D96_01290 [Candidatus Sedimenticola endophacoides]OQX41414.1 MAG: hypothetical protein B0D89_04170 [Candidatus Sedimenticola endophacoides]OQX48737.1 MAG: hypothetical protein B0D87_04135 [Candidatus Sedimenticola endophacoides]PUD98696.1 MAG: inositol monophosphatase [Candidatus Sedimenticola endophacoides]